jgi:hypothetical protein
MHIHFQFKCGNEVVPGYGFAVTSDAKYISKYLQVLHGFTAICVSRKVTRIWSHYTLTNIAA